MEKLTNPIILFWGCLLMHLIADYTLQGCLADLKQRDWWRAQMKQLYDKFDKQYQTYELKSKLVQKYRYDYMAGLACHALMWSILCWSPLLLICTPVTFSIVVIINAFVHFVVDHMKANIHCINLIQDQLMHLAQIVVTISIVS